MPERNHDVPLVIDNEYRLRQFYRFPFNAALCAHHSREHALPTSFIKENGRVQVEVHTPKHRPRPQPLFMIQNDPGLRNSRINIATARLLGATEANLNFRGRTDSYQCGLGSLAHRLCRARVSQRLIATAPRRQARLRPNEYSSIGSRLLLRSTRQDRPNLALIVSAAPNEYTEPLCQVWC